MSLQYFRELVSNEPLMRAVSIFNRHPGGAALLEALGGVAPLSGGPLSSSETSSSGGGFPSGEASGLEAASPPSSAPPYSSGGLEAKERLSAFLDEALPARPALRSLFSEKRPVPQFWDFGPEPRRLALLGDDEFAALTARFGAAVWGESLARTIEGAKVRALRASLGQELLDWAIERGRFLIGRLGGVYRGRRNPPESLEDLRQTGLLAVNVSWAPLPPSLSEMASHRLADIGALSGAEPGDLGPATFARLKAILLEVAPSWRPCFS
jgi:hypothetical protein